MYNLRDVRQYRVSNAYKTRHSYQDEGIEPNHAAETHRSTDNVQQPEVTNDSVQYEVGYWGRHGSISFNIELRRLANSYWINFPSLSLFLYTFNSVLRK